MIISVHRCDNFDVYTERIPIYPDTKERVMPDGNRRWDQRVDVEYVWRRKQVCDRTLAGENYHYMIIRVTIT